MQKNTGGNQNYFSPHDMWNWWKFRNIWNIWNVWSFSAWYHPEALLGFYVNWGEKVLFWKKFLAFGCFALWHCSVHFCILEHSSKLCICTIPSVGCTALYISICGMHYIAQVYWFKFHWWMHLRELFWHCTVQCIWCQLHNWWEDAFSQVPRPTLLSSPSLGELD